MSSVSLPQEKAIVQPRADRPTGAPRPWVRPLAYALLIFVAILMFVPFVWSITTSLKTNQEAALAPPTIWPRNPTLQAYQTILGIGGTQAVPFARWFLNSVLVAAAVVLARCLCDTMAAYAFARMRFPGKEVIFSVVLATLMVPGIVLLIPRFIILQNLQLTNTLHALWLPSAASAFGIFLMRQFFESLPIELEEAARIDGAGKLRTFFQIILPNATPGLAALAIFSFQGSWNNFLDAVIFISGGSRELFTLPLGLAYFRNFFYTDWPLVMAGAVITTIPIALVYIFFQRYFIEGVTSSAAKG